MIGYKGKAHLFCVLPGMQPETQVTEVPRTAAFSKEGPPQHVCAWKIHASRKVEAQACTSPLKRFCYTLFLSESPVKFSK